MTFLQFLVRENIPLQSYCCHYLLNIGFKHKEECLIQDLGYASSASRANWVTAGELSSLGPGFGDVRPRQPVQRAAALTATVRRQYRPNVPPRVDVRPSPLPLDSAPGGRVHRITNKQVAQPLEGMGSGRCTSAV